MKAITPATTYLPVPSRSALIDAFAKRSLLKLLSGMQGGSITLCEADQTIRIGDFKLASHDGESLNITITVHNPAFYRMVLLRGSIGAAEAYILNLWTTSDLTAAVRLICRNMQKLEQLDSGLSSLGSVVQRVRHRLRPNTLQGSRKNIHAHYDLSNDLFSCFLDSRMMYSAAVYPEADSSLETAAEFKLSEVGRKLEVCAEDHLLEIGSGWGGLAIYLAENYGCKVTTTTISEQQYRYVCKQVNQRQLQHRITVLDKDYRELNGQFDKLVSIEMVEAVGHRNLPTYFKKCNALLKHGGKLLLQSITIPEQRYDYARHNIDFIQCYIFPGGSLPSIESILRATGKYTSLQIEKLDDIGLHYAQTLKQWHTRFMCDPERIRSMGFDDLFIRLWQFYLCYCEGAFRERAISTNHILFRKV